MLKIETVVKLIAEIIYVHVSDALIWTMDGEMSNKLC